MPRITQPIEITSLLNRTIVLQYNSISSKPSTNSWRSDSKMLRVVVVVVRDVGIVVVVGAAIRAVVAVDVVDAVRSAIKEDSMPDGPGGQHGFHCIPNHRDS